MLSLNRYRLRHLVKKNHRGAKRAAALLERPDRLISVILIGNNLVNIFATIVAGIVTTHLFGEWATVAILPFVLTLVILIFAEVTPKSVAAVYPEKIAFPATLVLRPLLIVLYPVVAAVNILCNGIARIFGLDTSKARLTDHLRPEELRTVVSDSGALLPRQHRGMLLNILDLEKATVEDIMIPRNEVVGIDLTGNFEDALELIRTTDYTRLPVYEGDINRVLGVLHLRKTARFMDGDTSSLSFDCIKQQMSEAYFIPESTPLPMQLLNFQKEKRRMAMVVDEYGEVQGIATLVDLLEEIVGEFATDSSEHEREEITELGEQWYAIDGSTSIRDINRELHWRLPTDGPKTLNGLMVEFLESIPDALVSFQLREYRFELMQLGENRIKTAKVKRIEDQ